MFSQSTDYYDLIYDEFKDYESEAANIAELIREHHPRAETVLDVACGTGSHAALLHQRWRYLVDGVDIEEGFLDIARRKHPAGNFYCEDMSVLALNKSYDVILCLFSSIGYLKTPERITTALKHFGNHLNNGGLVILEPWFTPGDAKRHHMDMRTVDKPKLKVCRIGVSEKKGRMSNIRFEYLVTKGDEIRHFQETHELGLLTVKEMSDCFKDADFEVKHFSEGLTGRGIYIARRK